LPWTCRGSSSWRAIHHASTGFDGRVEIGYGVAEQFRGRGFATAAVRKRGRLALAAPGVVEVYAETAVGNASSRRIVEKAGFLHIGRSETKDDGIVDQWLLFR